MPKVKNTTVYNENMITLVRNKPCLTPAPSFTSTIKLGYRTKQCKDSHVGYVLSLLTIKAIKYKPENNPKLLIKSSSIFIPSLLLYGLKNFKKDQHRRGGIKSKGD